MPNALIDALDSADASGRLVWLDSLDFGARIVRNDKPFDWTDVTDFVSSFTKLQSLLKPDVVQLNVGQLLAAWLDANPGALMEMRGKKRIRVALKKFLGMEGPRDLAKELIGGLCASVSQPLVLVLPPNGDLINWANGMANQVAPVDITDIDVDTVSVYLADLIRTFNGMDVVGVMIQLPARTSINQNLLELYSPIINVARHCHWAFGIEVSAPAEVSDPDSLVDFVISEEPVTANDVRSGLSLNGAFWNGTGSPEHIGFYHAAVPVDIAPEIILRRISELKTV